MLRIQFVQGGSLHARDRSAGSNSQSLNNRPSALPNRPRWRTDRLSSVQARPSRKMQWSKSWGEREGIFKPEAYYSIPTGNPQIPIWALYLTKIQVSSSPVLMRILTCKGLCTVQVLHVIRLCFLFSNPTPGAIRSSDAAATLRWTRFDPNVGNCLYIKSNSTDAELQMVRHFRADKTALWNVVVPAIASSTRECGKSSCSGIVYDGTKIAVLIGIVAALSILLVFMICFNLCALRHGNVRFGRQQPTLGK